MNLLKTTKIAFGSVALASMVASPAMAFQLKTTERGGCCNFFSLLFPI